METAGGGWTSFVVRKEQTPQENFTRTWEEYANGFGDPENEYWLGKSRSRSKIRLCYTQTLTQRSAQHTR